MDGEPVYRDSNFRLEVLQTMFKLRSLAIAAFAGASMLLAGCSNANSIAPQPTTHSGSVSHPLCSIVPQQPDCAK